MKKILLISISLAPFLYANIPNNDRNLSIENNQSIETKPISQNSINGLNEELDYIFENSKFPVDDYIYKAGLRKPTKQEAVEETNKIQKEKKPNEPKKTEPIKQEPKVNLEEVKENERNFCRKIWKSQAGNNWKTKSKRRSFS